MRILLSLPSTAVLLAAALLLLVPAFRRKPTAA
jgi:hypothetical protein